jgi:hypothetical protein
LSLNSPIFVLALARLLTNLAEPNSCSAEAKAKNPKNKVLANNSAQCPLWVEPDDRSFDSWRLFWRSRRRAQSVHGASFPSSARPFAQRQIQRRQSGRSVANRRRRSDSEARMVRPKRPASFSSRAAKFTAGPMQVKSSRLPLPILPARRRTCSAKPKRRPLPSPSLGGSLLLLGRWPYILRMNGGQRCRGNCCPDSGMLN